MDKAARRTPEGSTVVLIMPTDGYRASAFMSAGAALGVDVVVATNAAPPLATEMEDRLVVVDLDHPEASAAKIASVTDRLRIDAVVGIDDQGILTASHANELLGLTHSPPDAVAATRDKADMRNVFRAWSVPQPEFRVALPGADVAALANEVGLPCVIKPVSLSASTGVIRADSPEEAVGIAERVRSILVDHDRPPSEPLLIERFIPGTEVSVEALMVDGDLQVLAIFDKPDPLNGPYFEETIYVTPSTLSVAQQDAVINATKAGCRALGLSHGPVHAEVRVGDTTSEPPDVCVLEVAARSIGGLCSRVLQFGTDTSLEELILRNALGVGTAGLGLVPGASGVMMLPIPRSGLLNAVDGVDAAATVAGVTSIEITASIGRPILALPEGGRYLGFIFARGDSPAEVESTLKTAHARLRIEIVDQPEPDSRDWVDREPVDSHAVHIPEAQVKVGIRGGESN